MPNRERLLLLGKGMLPRSVPRNPQPKAAVNDAVPEGAVIQQRSLPLTWDSDVIRRAKAMTNAGRTGATALGRAALSLVS